MPPRAFSGAGISPRANNRARVPATIVGVRTLPPSRPLIVMWALPLALWAAVPAVRWCPLGWQDVCATALLRCSAAYTPADCEAAAGHCPLAREPRAACSNEECPEAASCPLAHASSNTASPQRDAFPNGRAYCLGDPNGGAGLTSLSPHVPPSPHVVAVMPAAPAGPRFTASARRVPQLASRPPPRAWLTQPPARAPPASRLT
jgi:hypothetical protein